MYVLKILYCYRRHFDVSQQFNVLCRILNDQTQPMNNKVKHAWLEYVHELLPLMDCDDFKDTSGIYLIKIIENHHSYF